MRLIAGNGSASDNCIVTVDIPPRVPAHRDLVSATGMLDEQLARHHPTRTGFSSRSARSEDKHWLALAQRAGRHKWKDRRTRERCASGGRPISSLYCLGSCCRSPWPSWPGPPGTGGGYPIGRASEWTPAPWLAVGPSTARGLLPGLARPTCLCW